MSHFISQPPTRLHGPGRRLTSAEAQKFVADFLARAETDPALHPDSILTESGPQFATPGTTGLVLNSLKRFEAGLRGVHLAAEEDEELPATAVKAGVGQVVGTEEVYTGLEERVKKGLREGKEVGGVEVEEDAGEGMWQEKDEYEREQEVVERGVEEGQQRVVEEKLGRRVMPVVLEEGEGEEVRRKVERVKERAEKRKRGGKEKRRGEREERKEREKEELGERKKIKGEKEDKKIKRANWDGKDDLGKESKKIKKAKSEVEGNEKERKERRAEGKMKERSKDDWKKDKKQQKVIRHNNDKNG